MKWVCRISGTFISGSQENYSHVFGAHSTRGGNWHFENCWNYLGIQNEKVVKPVISTLTETTEFTKFTFNL